MTSLKTAAIGFGSGMLGALAMLAASGAAPTVKTQDVVQAKRFALVDSKGGIVGVWEARDGSPYFGMYHGEMIGIAATVSTEGNPMLMVGSDIDQSVMLSVQKGLASAIISNKTGDILAAPAGDNKSPVVQILDANDNLIFNSAK